MIAVDKNLLSTTPDLVPTVDICKFLMLLAMVAMSSVDSCMDEVEPHLISVDNDEIENDDVYETDNDDELYKFDDELLERHLSCIQDKINKYQTMYETLKKHSLKRGSEESINK